MRPSLTIFIPCAGMGSRLRPLTDRIPKPLIPFQGKSALRINWEKLQALQPEKILCNSHHLPEQIAAEAQKLGIEVVHEPEILGTGGCLTNLKSILSETDFFMVHNGDVLHNIDLPRFVQNKMKSPHIAHLAAIHNPDINSLSARPDYSLVGIKNYHNYEHPRHFKSLTFTGVAMYSRLFLQFCKDKPEDLVNFWLQAIQEGETIHICDNSESTWYDFGEPQGLWEAALWYSNSENPEVTHPALRARNIINETNLDLTPYDLHKALILEKPEDEGAKVSDNSIIGRDFRWGIR